MCRLRNFAVVTHSTKEFNTSSPPEVKRSRPTKPGDDLHGGKFRCRQNLPKSRRDLQVERGIIKQKLGSFISNRKLNNLKVVLTFIEKDCSHEKLRELEEDALLDGPDSKKARVQREIDEMIKAVRGRFPRDEGMIS